MILTKKNQRRRTGKRTEIDLSTQRNRQTSRHLTLIPSLHRLFGIIQMLPKYFIISLSLYFFAVVAHAEYERSDFLERNSNLAESKPKIYKHLSGGVTTFSDTPPARGAYTILNESCFACGLNSNIDWHTTKLYLNDYSGEIDAASEMYRLESSLVRAVIHAESGFRPLAKSKKGAVGLMQLMPDTARELGVTDARVPSYNIRGGTRYLAGLLMKFRGDINLAVAAYHAGPMAVEKHKGIPPYAETAAYVQRVNILYKRYKSVS